MKTRYRFLAGFGLAAIAVAVMGQVGLTTMPPNTLFGRIGVGQYGPGGAVPLSTIAANLGIGVTAHSVSIGKGTTTVGFNGAATGTAGQLLVDQGSGADPAFVPMSGSCTLAASGAVACAGLGGGVNSVTANYTATSSDCFKTIAAGGNTQFTITLNSAATYGACTLDISNVDAWGSGRGKVLAVTGLTTNPPVLYPGMTITLLNVSGTWFQKPGISTSQAPVGTKLYVDGVNGSDSNDCLASAQACQTLQHVVMGILYENLEATSGSATGSSAGFDIRLITDPACVSSTGVNCIHGLHMSGLSRRTEGHNSIMIECDGGSATNCTIADSTGAQAIGMYCACFLELKNVTLAGGNGGNNAIQAEKGMIRLEGGVVLGNTGSVAQLSAIDGGTIFLDGGTETDVSSGGNFFAQTARGGTIAMDQATIKWLGNATYSQTLNASGGIISATSTTWNTNSFTVTATNNAACSLGGFIVTSGTLSSVPGTNTQSGCTISSNGQAN